MSATFGELGAGSLYGVRDVHLFLLALNRPKTSVFGDDLYVTLEEKAAALAHGIITMQAFVDGNKRTGILAGMLMLRENGRAPIATPQALYEVATDVQARTMSQDDLVVWMRDWNNVLPVMEDEWDDMPHLFDPTAWDDQEE